MFAIGALRAIGRSLLAVAVGTNLLIVCAVDGLACCTVSCYALLQYNVGTCQLVGKVWYFPLIFPSLQRPTPSLL